MRVGRVHGRGLFHVGYEDVVERRLGAIEEYLGLPLTATREVDPQYRRVARSKTYSDWRNWFLPEDVEFFRPRMAEYMDEYGYGDDWTLPEESPGVGGECQWVSHAAGAGPRGVRGDRL